MAKPPSFDMQRGCYWLIALLIGGATLVMTIAAGGCSYMVVSGRAEIGACIQAGVSSEIREMFSEVLTAVLALLLAARNQPPPPPPPPDNPDKPP